MGHSINKNKRFRVELTDQQLQDLLSSIGYTVKFYPKDSPNFIKALGHLSKKLWKLVRKESK